MRRLGRAISLLLVLVGIPVGIVAFVIVVPGIPSVAQLHTEFSLRWVPRQLVEQAVALAALVLWAWLAIWVLREARAIRAGATSLAERRVGGALIAKLAGMLVMVSLRVPLGAPATAFAATPTAAVTQLAPQAAKVPAGGVHHSVVDGDTLWWLSEHYYGDGMQWPRIWHANFNVDPDPNLIYVGQVLFIPDVSRPAPPAPVVGPPAPPVPTQPMRGAPPVLKPAAPAGHSVIASPSAPGLRTNGSVASKAATAAIGPNASNGSHMGAKDPGLNGERTPASVGTASAHHDPADLVLPAGLIGASVLAAGLWRTIVRRRRRQASRAGQGRRPSQAAPRLFPMAAALRDLAAEDLLGRLEAALDVLSVGLAKRAGPAPLVLGALISSAQLVFCLGEVDRDAPAPFSVGEDGLSWTLARHVRLSPEDDVEVILPTLVSVGTTERGEQVLLNLEAFGAVSVAGQAAPDLVRCWALELATRRWSDCIEVAVVGFGDELGTMERIHVVDDLAKKVTSLANQGRRVAGLVDELGEASLIGARLRGQGDTWAPTVLCCLEAPGPAALAPLRLALADSARSGIVVVCAGKLSDASLELDADAPDMEIAPLGVVVRRNGISQVELADVGELLGATEAEGDIAAGDPPYDEVEISVTTSAQLPTEEVALACRSRAAELRVNVLGPACLSGAQGPITDPKAMELVVFLAMHPKGVSQRKVWDALWPGRPMVEKTLRNTASKARQAVGDASDGEPFVNRCTTGSYGLHPAVGSDYATFCALVAHARRSKDAMAEAGLLGEALALVRGIAFEQGCRRAYCWADDEHLAVEIELAVVDAACLAAEAALARGDRAAAKVAVEAGLVATPDNDRMYAMAMKVAAAEGDHVRVDGLMEELARRLDYDQVGELASSTYDNLRAARRSAPARA